MIRYHPQLGFHCRFGVFLMSNFSGRGNWRFSAQRTCKPYRTRRGRTKFLRKRYALLLNLLGRGIVVLVGAEALGRDLALHIAKVLAMQG